MNNLTWHKWNLLKIWKIIIYPRTHLLPLKPITFSVTFEFIPPDPWQSKGFLRRKKYFTMTLRCWLYVCSMVGTGWWAMSCDWMWLGANDGQKWHVWSFSWWAWRCSPVTGPTTRSTICPLKAPVVDGGDGGRVDWLCLRKAWRLWIKRDR